MWWVHFLSIFNDRRTFFCSWCLCIRLIILEFYAYSAIPRACKLDLSWNLKNCDRVSSDDTLVDYVCSVILASCTTSLPLCLAWLEKVMRLCCVRDPLWSSLWNAQFMPYSLAVCYKIHVKLVHANARWIGTIAYRVISNEMLARSLWFMLACLVLPKCFDKKSLYQLLTCLHARIWRDVIDACSWHIYFCSHAQILTRCLRRPHISQFPIVLAW